MTRRLPLLALLLAGCASGGRAPDPEPTLAAAPPAAREPAPEPAPAPPPAPAPRAGAARRAAAARPASPAPPPRTWGRVAITTAIVSPSELIGPAVPYATDYLRLPVFPEKLTLDVSWGVMTVGHATLQVGEIVMFNGRPAYHLVSQARSNSFCDTFYPVRDLNESWLDARTLTSLGYSKKLREGKFFRDEWTLYDRDAGTFVARRVNRDGSFAVRTGTIPANVQDVLSSIFYVRAQELKEGAEVIVDVNTPDNWPLVVRVGRRETVKVPAGRIAAIRADPAVRREGLFIQKGRDLRLWLSDDAARRPVLMKVEVFFGDVTAALREML